MQVKKNMKEIKRRKSNLGKKVKHELKVEKQNRLKEKLQKKGKRDLEMKS